jgi:hypothetical protein
MKGVAIPYVIGLLIAIIVLTIATYLIYLYVIQNKPLDCPECGAKFAAWCSKCYLYNWDGTNNMNDELRDCVIECNFWSSPSEDCSAAEIHCEGVGVPP